MPALGWLASGQKILGKTTPPDVASGGQGRYKNYYLATMLEGDDRYRWNIGDGSAKIESTSQKAY